MPPQIRTWTSSKIKDIEECEEECIDSLVFSFLSSVPTGPSGFSHSPTAERRVLDQWQESEGSGGNISE